MATVDWSDPFWAKACPEALSGCWLWAGYVAPNGYGRIWVVENEKRRLAYAHRIAADKAIGNTDGMVVCHKCDNPGCVNPDHLFIGTQGDNVRDMTNKGRARRSKALSDGDVEAARLAYADGAHMADLARDYGVSIWFMKNVLHGRSAKAAGGPIVRMPRRSGEEHAGSKLTYEAVDRIRLMGENGWSARAISGVFGVHKSTIKSVLSGATWSPKARKERK